MKYIVILCDGMADEPIDRLDGKTPLEAARTPNMDRLAKNAEIGMARTVPEGMAPGSDTANLSVIGYDPRKYYSGRSPLEALSIGADMGKDDVSFRCNLVTLSEEEDRYEDQYRGPFGAYGRCPERKQCQLERIKHYSYHYKYYYTGYTHPG